MLNTNIDNRKNLNEKIMNKYKKGSGGVYGGNSNKMNTSQNSQDISMSKSEYAKNEFHGSKTAGLYEKFINNKMKKGNLTKEPSFPIKANVSTNKETYLATNSNIGQPNHSFTFENNTSNNYLANSISNNKYNAGQGGTGVNHQGSTNSHYGGNTNVSGNNKKSQISSSHRKTESMGLPGYINNGYTSSS